MQISSDMLAVGRLLSEDDDFMVIEVAKNDKVSFTLQQDEDGETVGGDQFFTMLFCRSNGQGGMEIYQLGETET